MECFEQGKRTEDLEYSIYTIHKMAKEYDEYYMKDSKGLYAYTDTKKTKKYLTGEDLGYWKRNKEIMNILKNVMERYNIK